MSTSAISLHLTDDDFDRVAKGEMITKVVYLPSRESRAASGGPHPGQAGALASYDLPRHDAVQEAKRRGAILAVLRMGDVDLEHGRRNKGPLSAVRMRKGEKLAAIAVGDDGIEGRVVRARQGEKLVEVILGDGGGRKVAVPGKERPED